MRKGFVFLIDALLGRCEYRGTRSVQYHAEPDQPGRPSEGAQQQRFARCTAASI